MSCISYSNMDAYSSFFAHIYCVEVAIPISMMLTNLLRLFRSMIAYQNYQPCFR